MIWWRGDGHWVGILVALCIISAEKTLGAKGVAIGCIAAAGIVLAIGGFISEGSSMFSVPVKMWPYLLVLFAVIGYFSDRGRPPESKQPAINQRAVPAAVADAIAKLNEKMPAKFLNGRLQLDSVELADNVARFSGQQLWRAELTDQEKSDLPRSIKAIYCSDGNKFWVKAKIGAEYNFKTQPKSLNDIRVETWTVAFTPEQCA